MGDQSSKFEMPVDANMVFDNTDSSGFRNFFDLPAVRYSVLLVILSLGGCMTHNKGIIMPSVQKPTPTIPMDNSAVKPATQGASPGNKGLLKLEKPSEPEKSKKSAPPPPPPPPEPDEDRPIPCDELDLDEVGSCIDV